MFGISLGELSLIAIVALVVIGPEKLPQVARTIGMLAGKSQRIINDLKSEWVAQSGLEDVINETRDTLNEVSDGIHKISQDTLTKTEEEPLPTPPPADTPRRGFNRGNSKSILSASDVAGNNEPAKNVEAKQIDLLINNSDNTSS